MKRKRQGSPPRRAPAPDGEAFVERSQAFHRIVADASSLIVLMDIGALKAARNAWNLASPQAIVLEAGDAGAGVERLALREDCRSADAAVIAAAAARRLPVLSEDRKVLMAAEEAGLDCFDVLVALELLRAMGHLGPAAYRTCRDALLARNEYRPYRLAWAREVAAAADKALSPPG